MKILRVFPYRTNYTPEDDLVFIGEPPFREMIPEHDEVHVSCTFSWDKKRCEELAYQWEIATNKPVKVGGVAYDDEIDGFTQGLYIRKNIIFTTRGCNNNCSFCLVPRREGKLRELPICVGNWIQDNNFLQSNKTHKEKVFDMLRSQSQICFKGGLEADLIDDHFIRNVTSLRIKELWLACDSDGELPALKRACEKLTKAGFTRGKIKCYALSYGKDMAKDEARCRAIYEAGAMPFVQLYQEYASIKTEYPRKWREFARTWCRPAATKAHMKRVEFEREA